jgi:hypothetical protein
MGHYGNYRDPQRGSRARVWSLDIRSEWKTVQWWKDSVVVQFG